MIYARSQFCVKQIKMNKSFRLTLKSLQINHYCPLVFPIQFYHMQMLLSQTNGQILKISQLHKTSHPQEGTFLILCVLQLDFDASPIFIKFNNIKYFS